MFTNLGSCSTPFRVNNFPVIEELYVGSRGKAEEYRKFDQIDQARGARKTGVMNWAYLIFLPKYRQFKLVTYFLVSRMYCLLPGYSCSNDIHSFLEVYIRLGYAVITKFSTAVLNYHSHVNCYK